MCALACVFLRLTCVLSYALTCALMRVLSSACSHALALACALSRVCSHVCFSARALMRVLLRVCSHMRGLTPALSCVCSHIGSLFGLLTYTCPLICLFSHVCACALMCALSFTSSFAPVFSCVCSHVVLSHNCMLVYSFHVRVCVCSYVSSVFSHLRALACALARVFSYVGDNLMCALSYLRSCLWAFAFICTPSHVYSHVCGFSCLRCHCLALSWVCSRALMSVCALECRSCLDHAYSPLLFFH